MADHGSIILSASSAQDTKTIFYSLDEGLSFSSCDFSNGSAVDITNIIAQPTGTSQSFILHGKRQTSTGNIDGYLIHIDFNGIYPRKCVQSDYEDWCPSDNIGSGATCLEGESVCYGRRKQNTNCFNGEDHDPVLSKTQCVCSINDYECAECFEKVNIFAVIPGKTSFE